MFPDMTRVATELNKVVIALQQNTSILQKVYDELLVARLRNERQTNENVKESHKA